MLEVEEEVINGIIRAAYSLDLPSKKYPGNSATVIGEVNHLWLDLSTSPQEGTPNRHRYPGQKPMVWALAVNQLFLLC